MTPRSLNSKKKAKTNANKTYSALNMPVLKDKIREVGKS